MKEFGIELERVAALHARGALSDAEFAQAKALILNAAGGEQRGPGLGWRRLRRIRGDHMVAGICSGIGRFTGSEAWIWRLLFVLFTLFGGFGVVLYLLMWIFVPLEQPYPMLGDGTLG